MAYISANLYQLPGNSPGGVKEWRYLTTDSLATAAAAGYFADGALRGMHPGDAVVRTTIYYILVTPPTS